MSHDEICPLIQEADRRDWLGELDFADELPLVVPDLDQAAPVAGCYQLEPIVNVDGGHLLVVFKLSIHQQASLEQLLQYFRLAKRGARLEPAGSELLDLLVVPIFLLLPEHLLDGLHAIAPHVDALAVVRGVRLGLQVIVLIAGPAGLQLVGQQDAEVLLLLAPAEEVRLSRGEREE